MKLYVSDSRFCTSETLLSVKNYLSQKNNIATLIETGLELEDLEIKLREYENSKISEVIILIGVNDAAMRPFSRRLFRHVNRKRPGKFHYYFTRKILHFFNKHIFSTLMYGYYFFFKEEYDKRFERNFKVKYYSFIRSFPNLEGCRVMLNTTRPGVYQRYMPGYDNRIKIINNVLTNFMEDVPLSNSITYEVLNIIECQNLSADGVHFSTCGHGKIIRVLENES